MSKGNKKTAQLLKERLGGVPKTAMELSRAQAKVQRELRGALKKGPNTVPEIHAATRIPADEVLWHLMAMKKYGKVVEREERDGYHEYALAPKEGK